MWLAAQEHIRMASHCHADVATLESFISSGRMNLIPDDLSVPIHHRPHSWFGTIIPFVAWRERWPGPVGEWVSLHPPSSVMHLACLSARPVHNLKIHTTNVYEQLPLKAAQHNTHCSTLKPAAAKQTAGRNSCAYCGWLLMCVRVCVCYMCYIYI